MAAFLEYQPGAALVLAQYGSCTVAFDSDASIELAALWRAITSSEPVRSVLDELTRGGIASAPPFALVDWSGSPDDRATVVVRGALVVSVAAGSSSTRVDASDVATWREVGFDRVMDITVGRADSVAVAGDESYPLIGGIVRAISAHLAATVEAEAVRDEAAPATVAPPTVPTPVPENTITEFSDVIAPAEPPEGDDDDEYGHLFGATIVRSVEDAAVRPLTDGEGDAAAGDARVATAVAQPGSETVVDGAGDELGDHDGMTIVSGDLAKLREGSRPPAPTRAPVAPARQIFLELSTGSRETLAQPIVIGRSPSAAKVSSGQVPKLVAITGDQDISRNHAQFALQGGTVVVTDLHSRNGTSVILPGKAPQRLREGEPTPVLVGTVVDLGGGITVTVREE